MKRHTIIGAKLLKGREETFSAARAIALTHHERWDGSGYPGGLKGDNIPLLGRICAVADVFDALTSERPYKTAWTPQQAFNFIKDQRGKQFDPYIADAFISCKNTIMGIYMMYRNGQYGDMQYDYLNMDDNPQGWLSWNNSLSIGIKHIDMQHKYLITIINKLYDAVESGNEANIVIPIINQLFEYGNIHFKSEEQVMRDYNYPAIESHRILHEDFINKVKSYRQLITEFPLVAIRDLLIFLREWFSRHTEKEDSKIAKYVSMASEEVQAEIGAQRKAG